MLIGVAVQLLIFLGVQAVVTALLGLSVFRKPLLWQSNSAKLAGVFLTGPLMGYLTTSILFFFALQALGDTKYSLVVDLISAEPAEAAGMRDGDRVLAIDGQAVAEWEQVQKKIREARDRRIGVRVEREGRTETVEVTPRDGRIGIRPRVERRPRSLVKTTSESLILPLKTMRDYGLTLFGTLSGSSRVVEASGPVAIVMSSRPGSPGQAPLVFALLLAAAFPFALTIDAILFLVLGGVSRQRK